MGRLLMRANDVIQKKDLSGSRYLLHFSDDGFWWADKWSRSKYPVSRDYGIKIPFDELHLWKIIRKKDLL